MIFLNDQGYTAISKNSCLVINRAKGQETHALFTEFRQKYRSLRGLQHTTTYVPPLTNTHTMHTQACGDEALFMLDIHKYSPHAHKQRCITSYKIALRAL